MGDLERVAIADVVEIAVRQRDRRLERPVGEHDGVAEEPAHALEAEERDPAEIEDVDIGEAVGIEAANALVLDRFVDERRGHRRETGEQAREDGRRLVIEEPLPHPGKRLPAAEEAERVVRDPACGVLAKAEREDLLAEELPPPVRVDRAKGIGEVPEHVLDVDLRERERPVLRPELQRVVATADQGIDRVLERLRAVVVTLVEVALRHASVL